MISSILGAIGNLVGSSQSSSNAKLQMAKQEEVNRNQVQWRVADAKKAGVHPSVALGMSPMSYSPVSVGNEFAAMGQNLGRAIDATSTLTQRNDEYTQAKKALDLEKDELTNNLIASQVAVINQASRTPPMPEPVMQAHDTEKKQEPLRSPFGDIERSPRMSDVQDYTDRYGESADWIEGPLARWEDYKWNAQRNIEHFINKLKGRRGARPATSHGRFDSGGAW